MIRLSNTHKPLDLPFSYSNEEILTRHESIDESRPYVTAELSVSDIDFHQVFVVGDGKNYEKLSRTREIRDGSRITSFNNTPLEPDSFYSAFQRTFQDEVSRGLIASG